MKVPQTGDGGVSTQSGLWQEEESARGIKLNEKEGGGGRKVEEEVEEEVEEVVEERRSS